MYGQRPTKSSVVIQDPSTYAIKTSNTILCLFLFLLSIGIFGFGIWLAVWTNNLNYIGVILNYDIYRAGYILLIISGLLLMIDAFIGMSGSMQNSPCLLLTFVIVLITTEIMLITVSAVGMVFYQNFNSIFETNLTDSIKRYYGINTAIQRYSDLTTAIDQMQQQFSCCGASGSTNSSKSWELYKSSTWVFIQNNRPPYVPTSCCKQDLISQTQATNTCQGIQPIGNPAAPPVSNSFTQNQFLNTQGCITSMSSTVNYFSLAMFGLALGSALFVLILLILTFCLLRKIEVINNEQSNIIIKDSKKITQPNQPKKKLPDLTENSETNSPIKVSYKDSQKILK